MKPAAKRYKRDTILSFTAYVVVLFSVNYFLHGYGTDGWLPVVLAFLPVLPVLYFARAVLIFSRSWDELQKKIQFEAIIIAFFIVGLGTFTYGFLEGVGFPALGAIWILPMLLAARGVSLFFVYRTYT